MSNNLTEFKKDKNAMAALQKISSYEGILNIEGMAPYMVNMGGKPYISKGGLSLKLQEVANKRGGIKAILSIPVSYAHEGPEEMQKFLNLPPQLLDKILKERDYDMAAFTTPKGTALNKCIIIFGDGLKVSETAIANKENVKMSTIHGFLDVMAATRAYNRCVKKITAEGFMDANLIDEENFDYTEDDFVEDGELPFQCHGGGDGENQQMGEETQSAQERERGGEKKIEILEPCEPNNESMGQDVSKTTENKMICSECKTEINQAVSIFSKNKFGKELCISCQKNISKTFS
ncbi:hypothetical protein [Tepidibacter thalassicus]|uniref:Uncharacterized protein n=1 Tax=Tepidibacter thalassicus DSM 15285 TaxID=1123350 RepID=A0A1M5PY41_9FIRM|nr:hypothetical protein [Tepidibacter thalassicus]SHH06379.1 hypothetical protein SAMN02744040_00656 [Tepidibacter thalassicus DSM 15285]